jgi:hypothetical protein
MSTSPSISRWLSGAAVTGAMVASVASAQSPVPIRELSAPDATTTASFGNIFGVRQLADGQVLVNDGVRRQLVVLDRNFATRTVVVDSVAEGGQSYGPRAAPLIPYLADSSLFVDGASLSLLVIDPHGKVSHVMSAPKPGDLRFLSGSASGVDAAGNLIYRGALVITANRNGPATPGQLMAPIQPPDSAPIVRANFDTRMVDTVGRVKIQSGSKVSVTQDANGKMQIKTTINPLSTVDDWTVLSDGTIAIVRGQDYHAELVQANGKVIESPKLPFDWKRLTDEDKQALIDSARTASDKAIADAKANAANPAAAAAAGQQAAMVSAMASAGVGGGGGGSPGMTIEIRSGPPGGGGGGGAMTFGGGGPGGPGRPGMMGGMPPMTIEYVPLKEIADYYPAIRPGAVKADMDDNLWVLTTTSAQSKAGELIYDVINNRGVLTQRVRMPVGRSIAGFGRNGVVYLMHKDGTNGWELERTNVIGYTRATN